VPDAATLLLASAARLHGARGDDARAIPIWRSLLGVYPTAPEAPEAELEWARSLRRGGDPAAAIARLEHLILTYPTSALVPQARRELELARATVPPTP
jgi:TolA-binding protein